MCRVHAHPLTVGISPLDDDLLQRRHRAFRFLQQLAGVLAVPRRVVGRIAEQGRMAFDVVAERNVEGLHAVEARHLSDPHRFDEAVEIDQGAGRLALAPGRQHRPLQG